MTKRPNSRVNLDRAIERLFGPYESSTETRSVLANAVVGQMLQGAVVKGGSGLKFRYGLARTRATMDLDAACRGDIAQFAETLGRRLAEGWCGFTGVVAKRPPAMPRDVPARYVMQPYAVRLMYNGHSWCTVSLELGFNELGDADEADAVLSDDIADLFVRLGFPAPDPVPLMKREYQIAQKLHGLTDPGSRRVRDLIDLQLVAENPEPDLAEAGRLCRRLFSFRRMQPWPPRVEKGADWEETYEAANVRHGIARSLDEAVAWANDLVGKLDDASRERPASSAP